MEWKEVKNVDRPAGTYTIVSSGQITPINLIRTGTSICNRVGRRIQLVSLQLDGALGALRTAGGDYARIMVVYDKQPSPGTATISDILLDIDQAKTGNTDVYSHPNPNNVERFIILRDHRVMLPSITVTGSQITAIGLVEQDVRTFTINDYIHLNAFDTQYKADSSPAVLGDIASGALYLVTFGTRAAGTEGFQLNLAVRLKFVDG